jgi:hypothetical protein
MITKTFNSLDDVVHQYPISNPAWRFLDTIIVADAAELEHQVQGGPKFWTNMYDPWNRKFQYNPIPIYDKNNGDIIAWDHTTTVCGFKVKLKIFND